MVFSLTYELFRNVSFSLQTFEDFPEIFLLVDSFDTHMHILLSNILILLFADFLDLRHLMIHTTENKH